uniref:Uncharacterized protein n=1 Tax=Tanacetum cinerariifolium TaxID=118510 RepID=A0A699QSM2_TANCI|nr:hypothetical protein [Tanacetum cinerariifolium]
MVIPIEAQAGWGLGNDGQRARVASFGKAYGAVEQLRGQLGCGLGVFAEAIGSIVGDSGIIAHLYPLLAGANAALSKVLVEVQALAGSFARASPPKFTIARAHLPQRQAQPRSVRDGQTARWLPRARNRVPAPALDRRARSTARPQRPGRHQPHAHGPPHSGRRRYQSLPQGLRAAQS